MAWYAELKRRGNGSWLINRWSAVWSFKNKLREDRQAAYQQWYDSLSDEQKQKLEEQRRLQEEYNREQAEMALQFLDLSHKFLLNAYLRR